MDLTDSNCIALHCFIFYTFLPVPCRVSVYIHDDAYLVVDYSGTYLSKWCWGPVERTHQCGFRINSGWVGTRWFCMYVHLSSTGWSLAGLGWGKFILVQCTFVFLRFVEGFVCSILRRIVLDSSFHIAWIYEGVFSMTRLDDFTKISQYTLYLTTSYHGKKSISTNSSTSIGSARSLKSPPPN